MINNRKLLGRGLVLVALILMVVGEIMTTMTSLFATFGAMLIGGVGLYLAFDDQA